MSRPGAEIVETTVGFRGSMMLMSDKVPPVPAKASGPKMAMPFVPVPMSVRASKAIEDRTSGSGAFVGFIQALAPGGFVRLNSPGFGK